METIEKKMKKKFDNQLDLQIEALHGIGKRIATM